MGHAWDPGWMASLRMNPNPSGTFSSPLLRPFFKALKAFLPFSLPLPSNDGKGRMENSSVSLDRAIEGFQVPYQYR